MVDPPSPDEFEQSEEPPGDGRKVGFGWRLLYGMPLGIAGFFLRMLIPIVLVIIIAFIAQKIVG